MNCFYKIYILLAVISVASCTDKFINDLDIDIPDQEQLLVINLELEANSTEASTFVARTSNINETDATLYDEAIVELYKDDILLSELEYNTQTRNYEAQFDSSTLTPATYRIEVSGIENLTDISSTQIMSNKVEIQEGDFEADGTVYTYLAYTYNADEVVIKFNDPSDSENYYLANVYVVSKDTVNGQLINRNNLYVSSVNPLAEPLIWSRGVILKDDAFNGEEFELSMGLNFYYNQSASEDVEVYLEAELSNISRDHYLYLKSLDAFKNADENPFAEPVIVHNNIENGIGIFRTSNASRFRIDIE